MNKNGGITHSNQMQESFYDPILPEDWYTSVYKNFVTIVMVTILSDDVPCSHASYMVTSSNYRISFIQKIIVNSLTNLNILTKVLTLSLLRYNLPPNFLDVLSADFIPYPALDL